MAMIIARTGKKAWTNRHETFTFPIDDLYNLGNDNTNSILNDYNSTSAGIQNIIGEAVVNKKRLCALGGEWSWTKIAATNGILLNTKALNLSFVVNPESVNPSYKGTHDDLYFAQCGVSVQELSERLRAKNRSIKTSGASNGQTIVGAMSTGTHGAALDFGAIPEFVVGLHIIVSPTRQVWLERKSYPVVTSSFVQKLNAELIQDDELFNSALVSFGSFGFMHGVMIESTPLFLYEAHRFQTTEMDKLFKLMETLDFTNSFLPHVSERPFHFQVLINQYNLNDGAYVGAFYKRPFNSAYTPPPVYTAGASPGDDAPVFIGALTQQVPALVPVVVNALIKQQYKPFNPPMIGTHAEIFANTDTHGKVLSTAIGIPLDQVVKVKDLFIELNKTQGPFAGVLAFRFVKASTATLGFTHFSPATCVLELDGVFSDQSIAFYKALWNEMEKQNIPYTFHWGKMCELNPARLKKMYGDNIDKWKAARNKLLDAECLDVFTNPLLEEWGLSGGVGESEEVIV